MKNYSDITENLDITTKQYVDSGLTSKANLLGGNTFSGLQTINAPTNVSGSEQTTMKVKTSNDGAIIFGKEGPNSGTMIRLDQTDGTCRLRFRSSATAGAMVWEQPESGAQLYVDLGARGGDYHRVQFPSSEGTLALTSQIPTSSTVSNWGFTKNAGTVTSVAVKMNGETKGTVTSSGTIDLGTVLTDASKFATAAQGTKADNAVPNTRKVNNKALSTDIKLEPSDVGVTESAFPGLKKTGTITGITMNGESKGTSDVVDLGTVITADGGTINKSKTVKMDADANSNGANLKWGTVNSKNPYIGYASDQVDGTFVVGSLLGTNYASGLAIGGGSGNLLWKGTKVATTSDITAHSNIVATQTTLGHIKMYVEGDTLYLNT